MSRDVFLAPALIRWGKLWSFLFFRDARISIAQKKPFDSNLWYCNAFATERHTFLKTETTDHLVGRGSKYGVSPWTSIIYRKLSQASTRIGSYGRRE
jgi:hypothetical protein